MHLWAAPSGECFDFGYLDRNVQTEAQAKRALELLGLPTEKLRQRPWQPGLNTGPR